MGLDATLGAPLKSNLSSENFDPSVAGVLFLSLMGRATLSLHRRTFKLLHACPIPLLEISKQSGVGYYWIRKFKAGHIANPGANTLQMLYEFLACKRLGV
jgi:hypothetical protein